MQLDIGAARMKTLTVLGSTGSIGTNTLDVVRRNRHLYQVYALAAGRNVEAAGLPNSGIPAQSAVVGSSAGLSASHRATESTDLPRGEWPELLTGEAALVAIATAPEVDTVISAIVGVAGLEATYEAVCRGKRVGLANKEVLVSGGQLVMDAVRGHRSRAAARR